MDPLGLEGLGLVRLGEMVSLDQVRLGGVPSTVSLGLVRLG